MLPSIEQPHLRLISWYVDGIEEAFEAIRDHDVLGIVHCGHHTLLTDQPERALRLHVDVLGGQVVHEGRNELLGATSTYVHVAGSMVEFATPDEGTFAHRDWLRAAPLDTYHSLTWRVRDLDRVERHLESLEIEVLSRSSDTVITDPATSLGIPWGFTTEHVPGDPRHATFEGR